MQLADDQTVRGANIQHRTTIQLTFKNGSDATIPIPDSFGDDMDRETDDRIPEGKVSMAATPTSFGGYRTTSKQVTL